MARTLKQSGTWERSLHSQAVSIADTPQNEQGRARRKYDGTARLWLNVKEYNGFPDAVSKAIQDEYAIDAATAEGILSVVYEWHTERFWEDADECARYVLFGDESGALLMHTKEGHSKAKIESGGRSGGWLSVDWAPLTECAEYGSDRRLTAAERRLFLKFARQVGSCLDYLLSLEAVSETVAGNTHVWDITPKAEREREQYRAAFAEQTRGAE